MNCTREAGEALAAHITHIKRLGLFVLIGIVDGQAAEFV